MRLFPKQKSSRLLFGLRAVSSQCKWIQTTTIVFTWSFKLLLGSFTWSFFLNSMHLHGNVLPPFLFPWISLLQLCANIFTCISTKWGLKALKGQEPSAGGCWQEKMRLESSTQIPSSTGRVQEEKLFASKEEKQALDSGSEERGESFWEGISDHLKSLKETLQHFCSLVERTGMLRDFLRRQCGGRAEVMETKKTDSSKYLARHF